MEKYLHGVEVIEVNGFNDVSNIFNSSELPTPVFTSFEIQGQNNEIEIGDSITAGSKMFTWIVTNPTSVNTNSIRILNVTNANAVLAQNLPNTGSALITLPEILNNTETTQVFRIELIDSNNVLRSREFTIYWDAPIFRDTFQRASLGGDYSFLAPVTANIVANKLRVQANGLVINPIRIEPYYSSLDEIEASVRFIYPNTAVMNTGLGIRYMSNASPRMCMSASLHYTEFSANNWQIKIFGTKLNDINSNVLQSSFFNLIPNDELILYSVNNRRSFTATLVNALTGAVISTITYNYLFVVPFTEPFKPNSGYIDIWVPTVTTDILEIKIKSLRKRRGDLLMLGDSLLCLAYVGNGKDTIDIFADNGIKMIVSAGGGNRLNNIVLDNQTNSYYKTKVVGVEAGTNSWGNGVTIAACQAQLQNIVDFFHTRGYIVAIEESLPRNDVNPTYTNVAYNAMLPLISNATIITYPTALNDSSDATKLNTLYSDETAAEEVHLNVAGNLIWANHKLPQYQILLNQ